MITRASNSVDQRPEVILHLSKNKYQKVIDVGASRNPWARPYITHTLDLCPTDGGEIHYVGDMNEESAWDFGSEKFDYAICTQTLEDLRDPQVVLRNLPRIAKRGYIDVPNKRTELEPMMENCDPETEQLLGLDHHKNRGFMHHRWIFTIRNDKLILYPKLGFIDRMTCFDDWLKNQPWPTHWLSFWWENDIPFETWNNDYLGPNGGSVVDAYRNTLLEGL